ncbi:MAG: phage tail protein, partial [Candidatus Geothermincolia bacterium]
RETIQKVFNAIKTIIETAVKVIQGLWDRFGKNIVRQIEVAWNFIKRIFEAAFKVIKGIWDVFAGLFSGNWGRFWDGIKGIFSGVWNAITAIFRYVWDTIKNYLSTVWNAITGLASAVWGRIKTAIEAPVAAVAGAVVNAFIWVRDALASSWNWITSIASSAWGAIKTAIWTPINWVGGAIVGAWEWVRDALSNVWNTIAGVASSVWNGIVDTLSWAVNQAISGLNVLIRGVNQVSGALDFLAGPFVNWGNIPEIPHLARGGIVTRPTVAMLGDNPGHKEAVIPLSGPNAAAAGIGGGMTFSNCTFLLPNAHDAASFYDDLSRTAGRKTGLEKWVRG